MLAGQIRHFLRGLVPLEYPNDLLFAESTFLHPFLLVSKSYLISDHFLGSGQQNGPEGQHAHRSRSSGQTILFAMGAVL